MEGLGPPPGCWTLINLIKSCLLVALLTMDVHCRLPVPCTDLKPIYLLHVVAPDRYRLPPGVEITYDEHVNLHAFHLTTPAQSLHFPSSQVFRFCEYFPEEFSMLVTFRAAPQAVMREENVFSVRHPESSQPRLGLRILRGKVQMDYHDRRSGVVKMVEFDQVKVVDGGWHTLILSLTGNKVSLRKDCGKARTRRLKRAFPAFLSIRNTNFHIGNANNKHTIFTGLLKQLMLLPGIDASAIACPATDPRIPDVSRVPPIGDVGLPLQPSYPLQAVCTWRDTGKLWFDVLHKTLNVCYSGLWQAILLPPGQRSRRGIDYVVWHQDLVTAAPTIDLEVFTIPGEGLFMATASYSDSTRGLKKQQSTIFKWEEGRFKVYQSLYTLGAQGWEHFAIGKQFFLAVANHGPRRDRPSKSVIYRWSRNQKRFNVHQELVTWTARDLEYFEIEGQHYLAVANHVNDQNHTIGSDIYLWDKRKRKFSSIQTILTVGAYDWTHFQLQDYHFLVVANSFSGPPTSTTRLKSVIYFWQKGHFIKFQTLETTGATDWEFFIIQDDYYLVVANAFNYGPHATDETDRYKTNSTIYRLNKLRKQFEMYQSITTYSKITLHKTNRQTMVSSREPQMDSYQFSPTTGPYVWPLTDEDICLEGVTASPFHGTVCQRGAVDWEAFTVGEDSFLVVSNAQQHGGASGAYGAPREHYTSVIYRWQGVEKFVEKHQLNTHSSADWETFKVDGEVYLVYANAKDNVSQVFKVKFS